VATQSQARSAAVGHGRSPASPHALCDSRGGIRARRPARSSTTTSQPQVHEGGALILIASEPAPATCQAAPCAAPWGDHCEARVLADQRCCRWGPPAIGPPCTGGRPRGSFLPYGGRTGSAVNSGALGDEVVRAPCLCA
jgi:hypothetical protein